MLGRARREISSNRPARGLTLALGAAAVAVAVVMTAAGRWGAAVVAVVAGGVATWLAGAWVVPGGEDAYCRRVERSVREGLGRMAGSYETFERYARRQRARLDRLQPPTGLEKDHAGLMELLDQADKSANDPSLTLRARAADATRSLQRAREQRRTLTNQREDATHRRYAAAVSSVAQSSRALLEGAFKRAEEAACAMVDRLERTAPPASLAARHDALVDGFRRYLQAMRAYHDAVRELDPDRVAAGVDQCELAKGRVEERIAALWEETTRRGRGRSTSPPELDSPPGGDP